jgi:hypothetical protein
MTNPHTNAEECHTWTMTDGNLSSATGSTTAGIMVVSACLTPAERSEFVQTSKAARAPIATFCSTFAYTGCRISEALALTADRVDLADGVLIFETPLPTYSVAL